MREKLAGVYESEEDFLEAAKILQGIPLDSGHRYDRVYAATMLDIHAQKNRRSISDDYKLRIYIRIVRLLLEVDVAVSAEAYLNRAALLIPNSTDFVLGLTFKLSQARILDAKRRFLEACSKYHELSYVTQLDEDERIQCLYVYLLTINKIVTNRSSNQHGCRAMCFVGRCGSSKITISGNIVQR